jgi:hypothetical protein
MRWKRLEPVREIAIPSPYGQYKGILISTESVLFIGEVDHNPSNFESKRTVCDNCHHNKDAHAEE